MKRRLEFYRRTIATWIPDRHASVLVVAGGANDRDVFLVLGFDRVVVSNVGATAEDTAPYPRNDQDAEALTFADEAFDYAVVHAGLHHCRSPHRALLEMYRVARRAAIAFEPPDNLLVRAMQWAGLAQTYEYTAVESQEGRAGGVNDTEIPNYIYRWREQEIEKAVSSYAPHVSHRFRYAYGSDVPTPEYLAGSVMKRALVWALLPLYRLWGLCLPRQQNLFAFMIEKPDLARDLQPWLLRDEAGTIHFNPGWGRAGK